jgi:hypothetical protein
VNQRKKSENKLEMEGQLHKGGPWVHALAERLPASFTPPPPLYTIHQKTVKCTGHITITFPPSPPLTPVTNT